MQWLVYGVVFLLFLVSALLAFGIYISPRDELVQSDVVVAVSGGNTRARTMEAIDLYEQEWVSHIIFSGAARDPRSESNAAVMRDMAVASGVSPDVITIEEEAGNTRQNAARTASLIRALDYDSVILVTSPYHQRRMYIEFQNQLGPGVRIINRPASDKEWSRQSWWRSSFGWYITASEAPKVLYSLTQS